MTLSTELAIDFIKRNAAQNRPFFAYLPYTQTHEPVDPHPDFKGNTGNGSFADVLAQTDFYVGSVLRTIEDLVSEMKPLSFLPLITAERVSNDRLALRTLARHHVSPYEDRFAPFLIRYPKEIPAKQVSNELMHLVDIFQPSQHLRAAMFRPTEPWMARIKLSFVWSIKEVCPRKRGNLHRQRSIRRKVAKLETTHERNR